ILRGSKSDSAVLLTTFLLTIFIDLTVAIEIGMLLAVFLFMRKMIRSSEVNVLTKNFVMDKNGDKGDQQAGLNNIPAGAEVFEIKGPLFFGVAYKFKDAMKLIEK